MKLGRVPTGPLRSLLRRRATAYTIYETVGDDDSWTDGGSTLSAVDTAQLDIYGYSSRPQSYPTGEVDEASVSGLMDVREKTPDIQNDVCIVHGGQVFEVQFDPWPNGDDPTVYRLDCTERTDLTPP